MPNLKTPRNTQEAIQELDRTYTPMENRRRQQMKLHTLKYGCYYFTGHPTIDPTCYFCDKPITGGGIIIDGRMHCSACLKKNAAKKN